MPLSLIVALDRNGLIGAGAALPWRLPADLRYFKERTMGRTIIMGRKTCASIGRPLPGRRNVVLSGNRDFRPEGFVVCATMDDVLARLDRGEEAMVIGGAAVYRLFWPMVTVAYVTLVDGEFSGDVWFPCWPLPPGEWSLVARDDRPPDEKNPWPMAFLRYERAEINSVSGSR